MFEFFRFELRQQLRSPLLWMMGALFAALAFGAAATDVIQLGGGIGNVHRNAPMIVVQFLGIFTLLGMLFIAMSINGALLRDFEQGTAELIFASPIKRRDYVAGRIAAAVLGCLLIYALIGFGIFIAQFMPWIDAKRLGPVSLYPYAWAFAVIVLPNLLFTAALLSLLAIVTRSILWVYIGVLGFFILSGVSAVLLRDLDILAGQCKRQALGIAPRGGDKALLRQLLGAARIALGLLQCRTAACRAHVGPLHPRLRGFHPGLLLTQAACIKQGGQGRCDARQHIARLHRIAFAQVHAQQAPRQRGRNAVAVPQAGAGIVVDAGFEAALHHWCHFDLHRPGCKRPGQQRGQRQRRSAAVCHGFLVHCACFSSCRFQSLRGRVIRAF